jgi:hypothetical protein
MNDYFILLYLLYFTLKLTRTFEDEDTSYIIDYPFGDDQRASNARRGFGASLAQLIIL